MTEPCRALAAQLDAYREERLPAAERRAFREHLAACGSCRSAAIAAEPTLVFAVAPPAPPIADSEARAILENVRAAIAVREAARRAESGGRHGRRSAAALATAAALALAFSTPLVRRPVPPPAAAARPALPAGIAGAANRIVRPGSEEPSMPSSATIYEWNPGTGSPEDPKIVWIVDRSLDL